MATNGSTSSIKSYDGIRVTYRQISQNIANNTSLIRATAEHYSTAWSRWDSTSTLTITVNGTSRNLTVPTWNWSGANSVGLGSVDFTVPHNSDGTKSVSLRHSWNHSSWGQSASSSMKLDTIPRASTIGNLSGTTIGSEMTVSISRKASSFTHQVWYRLPGQAWQNMGTGHTTSCKFTIPVSQSSYISNSTSGQVEIAIQTKSGSTNIGDEARKKFTVHVPTSVKPSISGISVAEANTAVGMYDEYIQNLSRLKVAITGANGAHGSTIKSYRIEVDRQRLDAQSGTTHVILKHGTLPIVATVTDSRNRTATRTMNIQVVKYSFPVVEKYSFRRCRKDGTPDELGEYVRAEYRIRYSRLALGTSGVEQNTFNHAVDSKKAGTSESFVQKATGSNTVAFIDSYSIVGVYNLDSVYDFRIRGYDRFRTTVAVGVVGRGIVSAQIFDDGMAIGMITDKFQRNLYVGEKGMRSMGPIYGENNFPVHELGSYIVDHRQNKVTPHWYQERYPKQTVHEFILASSVNLPNASGTYVTVETIIPWRDSSGGNIKQIAYGNNGEMFYRTGVDLFWDPWTRISGKPYVATVSARGGFDISNMKVLNKNGVVTVSGFVRGNIPQNTYTNVAFINHAGSRPSVEVLSGAATVGGNVGVVQILDNGNINVNQRTGRNDLTWMGFNVTYLVD